MQSVTHNSLLLFVLLFRVTYGVLFDIMVDFHNSPTNNTCNTILKVFPCFCVQIPRKAGIHAGLSPEKWVQKRKVCVYLFFGVIRVMRVTDEAQSLENIEVAAVTRRAFLMRKRCDRAGVLVLFG